MVVLRELVWYRLWWIIWKVFNHGKNCPGYNVFHILSHSVVNELGSSKDADSHLILKSTDFGHLTKPTLTYALGGMWVHEDIGVKCWGEPWRPLLWFNVVHLSSLFTWYTFRFWQFRHPEMRKPDETHHSHFLKHTCLFINASKGHLYLLMLQVSTAM